MQAVTAVFYGVRLLMGLPLQVLLAPFTVRNKSWTTLTALGVRSAGLGVLGLMLLSTGFDTAVQYGTELKQQDALLKEADACASTRRTALGGNARVRSECDHIEEQARMWPSMRALNEKVISRFRPAAIAETLFASSQFWTATMFGGLLLVFLLFDKVRKCCRNRDIKRADAVSALLRNAAMAPYLMGGVADIAGAGHALPRRKSAPLLGGSSDSG